MCQGTSVRRRALRLLTGANRKLSVFRWISRQTVGVCQLFRAPVFRQVGNEKAEEGAEKSFRSHNLRRRRRGQRVGRPRKRTVTREEVNLARDTPVRPAEPKGVSARVVNHSGRKFIWAQRARSRVLRTRTFELFDKKLSEPPLSGLEFDERVTEAPGIFSEIPSWQAFSEHLRRLRSRARQCGIVGAANPFESNAIAFIEINSLRPPGSAWDDILEGLKFNLPNGPRTAVSLRKVRLWAEERKLEEIDSAEGWNPMRYNVITPEAVNAALAAERRRPKKTRRPVCCCDLLSRRPHALCPTHRGFRGD
jgi:hypothetical protein